MIQIKEINESSQTVWLKINKAFLFWKNHLKFKLFIKKSDFQQLENENWRYFFNAGKPKCSKVVLNNRVSIQSLGVVIRSE